jgi:general secretion pathway protein H
MPISVTGICSRAGSRAAARGFTLLELLVVVTIIGILAGAVVLSLGSLGNDREIEQETGRLRSLLNLLHEESLMQSRDYGVMFTATGYRFYIYDYTKLGWVEPLDDRLLEPYHLKPQLDIALVLDGREVALLRDFKDQDVDKPDPQVMVLSSGELTPFTVEMSREGRDGRFVLTGELDGTFKVEQEGFDDRR